MKAWDINKLNEALLPGDISAVLQVPLLDTIHEDKLVWNMREEGNYSVKSNYWLYAEKLANADQLRVNGD